MKRIASFSINHDALTPGMYISRIDGDCITYDLRMKTPNAGDYLDQKGLHTLEHLLAPKAAMRSCTSARWAAGRDSTS